ncbi:peroxidasin-like [Oppia nitens]|uniref:peroxidasin-like n=1 Tax=Oppia nitens TaxID=1686743 RepID=UPI0023DA64F4|nr:peroxidasin-like [Oppia nitens]
MDNQQLIAKIILTILIITILSVKSLNTSNDLLNKLNVEKLVAIKYDHNICYESGHIKCNLISKYRTLDGTCNNAKNPFWGKSSACFSRILGPAYGDGIKSLRLAHNKQPLPNTRSITNALMPDKSVYDTKLTGIVVGYGQFVVHDASRARGQPGDTCCGPPSKRDPECLSIDILSPDDYMTKQWNQTCMVVSRDFYCTPCAKGAREQINDETPAIDLSHVYGQNDKESQELRSDSKGQLRVAVDTTKGEFIPPPADFPSCNPRAAPDNYKCFHTGDSDRGNMHPLLQSFQVTFLRRHNQHALALLKLNPHWDDDQIFHEARRISIAEHQHIIYNEYLPASLGPILTKIFNLKSLTTGYTQYDPEINFITVNEFAVGSARFGHSQINGPINLEANGCPFKRAKEMLRNNYYDPTLITQGKAGSIIAGLLQDKAGTVDQYHSVDIDNYFGQRHDTKGAIDLAATDIMRNRDHGIPSYTNFLGLCYGINITSWNDLTLLITANNVDNIKKFYNHWTDIDLHVGAMHESNLWGSHMGPTYSCLNGIQFNKLKFGDRFYYEHDSQSGSFNKDQLNNIRKVTTLGSIICKTQRIIHKVQKNVFIQPSLRNSWVDCNSLPEIDYKLFSDL